MATVIGSGQFIARGVHKETWSGFAASGDVGTALNAPQMADKTVSVDGTFTGAPTIVIEGGSDGVNFDAMHDINGNALSFTAAGTKAIAENPLFLRPRASAGTGGAAVNVVISSAKAQ